MHRPCADGDCKNTLPNDPLCPISPLGPPTTPPALPHLHTSEFFRATAQACRPLLCAVDRLQNPEEQAEIPAESHMESPFWLSHSTSCPPAPHWKGVVRLDPFVEAAAVSRLPRAGCSVALGDSRMSDQSTHRNFQKPPRNLCNPSRKCDYAVRTLGNQEEGEVEGKV